jgi:2'-5' RNA ligase
VTKKRLFFALWPSEEHRQKIDAAIRPYRSKLAGTWTERDNWHVTLFFIGGFPEDDIPLLRTAAHKIDCPSLDLKFERIYFWNRPKIICLFAAYIPSQLLGLVRSLESTAQSFGIKPDDRPYRAHMTIARKARFFEPITLAQPLELHWSTFRLIESISTPSGVQYKPLDQ